MKNDYESLTHTKWRCQYHIVLTPKYRRQIIYGKYKTEIGKILRTICERYDVEIIEAQACPDHIHMLVAIPPKMAVSRFMGILKGKSALMIFDRFANLKYKYGNRHFWCRGYFVDTVGRNKTAIQQYIQNQLSEDKTVDQISMKEFIDPFTGEPTEKGDKSKPPDEGGMPVTMARLPGFQSAKSARWYQALTGPTQATGSAGGYDSPSLSASHRMAAHAST